MIEGFFCQTRSEVRPTLHDKKSSMIGLFLRQTRSPMRSILGAPPPENVRKNCIKRDFIRYKKRAIAPQKKVVND